MGLDSSLAVFAGIVFSIPISKWMEGLPGKLASSRIQTAAMSGGELLYFIFLCAVLFLSSMSLAGGTYNPFIYFRF
jgi:hypothetical protein